MKLLTLLLTGTFLAGGFGAHATFYEQQQATENTHVQEQTINQLTAAKIALDLSNGGLVTKTHMTEEKGNKKYEISLNNHDKEFQVYIDASTGEVLNYHEKTRN